MHCSATEDIHDRLCRIRNLCLRPSAEYDEFFLIANHSHTLLSNVPADRFAPALVALSALTNHNTVYMAPADLPAAALAELQPLWVEEPAFLFRRFKPDNLMHVLHDDVLPLHHTLAALPAGLRLVALENWDPGPYAELYRLFSAGDVLFRSQMAEGRLVCFRDAHLGMHRPTTWYDYGFDKPQGPIANKTVSGHALRRAADYLRAGLRAESESTEPVIVVFSRGRNRRMLNEAALAAGLAQRFGLAAEVVSLETHTLRQVIQLLGRARLAVGMHGSILITALFLRPGAGLVELFPYAVPPENYTPYRTLAGLPGMGLAYRAWRNTCRACTVGHPQRERDAGGLLHLDEAARQAIVEQEAVPPHQCCMDPSWLYHIYQDTLVDIDEVLALAEQAWEEGAGAWEQKVKGGEDVAAATRAVLTPSRVLTSSCQYVEALGELVVRWRPCWNCRYLPDTHYEVWIEAVGKAWRTPDLELRLRLADEPELHIGRTYRIWLRAATDVHGTVVGAFGAMLDCMVG